MSSSYVPSHAHRQFVDLIIKMVIDKLQKDIIDVVVKQPPSDSSQECEDTSCGEYTWGSGHHLQPSADNSRPIQSTEGSPPENGQRVLYVQSSYICYK